MPIPIRYENDCNYGEKERIYHDVYCFGSINLNYKTISKYNLKKKKKYKILIYSMNSFEDISKLVFRKNRIIVKLKLRVNMGR